MVTSTEFPKIEKEKAIIYRYILDIVLKDPDNEKDTIKPIKKNTYIKKCEYFDKFSPFISLNCLISIPDIIKIKKIEKKLIATITVTSKRYIRESNDLRLIETKIESSGIYIPVFGAGALSGIKDDEFKDDHDTSENTENKISTSNTVAEKEYKEVNISFIDKNAVNTAKKVMNLCFDSDWKVGTVLLYIANQSDAKQYLIDMPDNQEPQQESVLPPNNFIQTLNTLQSVFGVYNSGLATFYDDDTLYILNKYNKEHDLKEKEVALTHLYIEDKDKNPLGSGDIVRIENDNKEPAYIGTIKANLPDVDVIIGEKEADTMIFSNFSTGHNVMLANDDGKLAKIKPPALSMKKNRDSHKHSGNRITFDYDELNNPFNMASYFNELETESSQCSFLIKNINMNDFKMNKFVYPHFRNLAENQRYEGVYNIKEVNFVFEAIGNSDEMVCACSVSLCKRVKKEN